MRLMSDLEEEILFLLGIQEASLMMLEIFEHVSRNMSKAISLSHVHETLIQLESAGLVTMTRQQPRKHYSITVEGIATLQRDWNKYSSNIKRI